MTKHNNFTCSDLIHNEIIEGARPEGMTRSEWISTLILKGHTKIREEKNENAHNHID